MRKFAEVDENNEIIKEICEQFGLESLQDFVGIKISKKEIEDMEIIKKFQDMEIKKKLLKIMKVSDCVLLRKNREINTTEHVIVLLRSILKNFNYDLRLIRVFKENVPYYTYQITKN